ncbi:hypothetical protein EXIGLDRAFT_780318 [Exidia glandulosa HHB12029]|uniref:G-protein coupled receptors family 1 profile domain-containing protein n=1 Tax=Exidia glandulosa HHB12029 TaxID=1314781 RepID=A0A165BNN1_EXIGL|nr:hypothetical protein EXIGLDRAFT_780318 [Exidia glandulosa HHB12029]
MSPNPSTFNATSLELELHVWHVQVEQGVYFSLVVFGGLVLLPLVLLTFAFAKRGSRNSSLINFLAGLSIFSLGIVVLPLTGHLQTPVPPRNICLAQLGTIYPGLIITSVAAVMLVLQLLLTLPGSARPLHGAVNVTIAASPVASGVGYTIIQTSVAAKKADMLVLTRGHLVCSFDVGSPFFFRKGPLVILAIAFVIAIAVSGYMWVRMRATLRRIGAWQWKAMTQSEHGPWMSILLRMIAFEILATVAALLIILSIATANPAVHTLAVGFGGITPLLAFLVFGTVDTVRTVWFRWCFDVRDYAKPKTVEAEV